MSHREGMARGKRKEMLHRGRREENRDEGDRAGSAGVGQGCCIV